MFADIPIKRRWKHLLEKVDIVTYEFENIPIEILKSIVKEKVIPKPEINQIIKIEN